LEDSTFTDQKVVRFSQNMIFVKAEAGVDSVTREKYKIAGFPTIILMNSSGEEIDRIFGFLPPDDFVSTIQDYLQGKNTLDDLKKRFQEDSTDVELASKLAEKYEGRSEYDQAATCYKKVLDLDPRDEKGFSDDALMSLAWLEVRKKEYLKAIETFEYFLQKFPKSELAVDAEVYIPYSYARAGDTTKAIGLYEEFLSKHPDSEDTAWVRGNIKKLKGEEE
jgi:outer membrane protein assembly factor BamD (BamD/ComL family)